MAITQAEQNKALFSRWFDEAWNKANFTIAYELVAPTMLVHGAGGQTVKQGPDGVIEFVKMWKTGFPDGHMSVDLLVTEGDKIAALLFWRGTHLGDFNGISPTGKKVQVMSIGIDRIVDGKIVEGWGEVDMLDLQQQLGLVRPYKGSLSHQDQTDEEQEVQSPPLRPAVHTGPSENKTIALRFLETLYNGDLREARALMAPAYVEHNPYWGTISATRTLQLTKMQRNALPDLHYTHDPSLLLGEREYVAVRGFLVGTHTGADLMGTKASGKKADWTGIEILHVLDGKIAQRWQCQDILRFAQKLDFI